jgi:hypothetical protein
MRAAVASTGSIVLLWFLLCATALVSLRIMSSRVREPRDDDPAGQARCLAFNSARKALMPTRISSISC